MKNVVTSWKEGDTCMTSTYNPQYLYDCKITCSKEPYGKEEVISISFKSGNRFLSYRDVRTEVINRVPDKYQVFHVVTYEVKES